MKVLSEFAGGLMEWSRKHTPWNRYSMKDWSVKWKLGVCFKLSLNSV